MTVVLLFGDRPAPRALRGLPSVAAAEPDDIDAAAASAHRLVVVGSASDLAAVLTRLLRTERLDVEVAHVRGRFGQRRALTGTAQRVPLIRDDTGNVVVTAAHWLPPEGSATILGEAVVDDTVLFDGPATGVRIEPIAAQPGLRATLLTSRWRRRRWVTGRAAQLGTTGARVVRDGVPAPREVRRSTFYRHTQGWLWVR